MILASNVFAHSDKLKEMTECMLILLSKKGTIIIEVQYLMNTLKDLTFDNIYHEHYNYWSLTSLVNFFNQFDARIVKSELVNTHGGSIRDLRKKNKKGKVHRSVKKMLKRGKNLELKNIKHTKHLVKKFIKLERMLEKILKNLKIITN